MFKTVALLIAGAIALSACASETPIRKTNCWNTMALNAVAQPDCEFRYVPAR